MDLDRMTFSQLLDARENPHGGLAINDYGRAKIAINDEIDRRWKLLVDCVEMLSDRIVK